MSKVGTGLKLARVEHNWERKTNIAIVLGLSITCVFYYFRWKFIVFNIGISASEVGIFFLVIIGICHLIARLGHTGEQHFLKNTRRWKK